MGRGARQAGRGRGGGARRLLGRQAGAARRRSDEGEGRKAAIVRGAGPREEGRVGGQAVSMGGERAYQGTMPLSWVGQGGRRGQCWGRWRGGEPGRYSKGIAPTIFHIGHEKAGLLLPGMIFSIATSAKLDLCKIAMVNGARAARAVRRRPPCVVHDHDAVCVPRRLRGVQRRCCDHYLFTELTKTIRWGCAPQKLDWAGLRGRAEDAQRRPSGLCHGKGAHALKCGRAIEQLRSGVRLNSAVVDSTYNGLHRTPLAGNSPNGKHMARPSGRE